MSCLTIFLSPLNLLFFIIVAGLAIGKIRIKGISLNIAGILFASIFVGFLMNLLIWKGSSEIISNVQGTMKIISKLGTSLFVSVIGLQTGFSIKNNSKVSMIGFAIGALMSISGVMVMLLISTVDKSISYSSLLGILCGALTSTPGLSSVCELIGSDSEATIVGYGYSYIVGVVSVVLFSQVLSRKEKDQKSQMDSSNDSQSKTFPELMLICTTALLGNILGNVKITFLNISFGTTASTLIMGLLIGFLFCKKRKPISVTYQTLNDFKNFGLALFFTGIGFTIETQALLFDIKIIFYGMLISLFTIFFGLLLCEIAKAKYDLHQGFIVAGGMTSSPAYGAISSKATETSTNCFSFAYFGALMSLMIAIQIITR